MPWRANEAMYGPGGGEWVDDNGTITPDPYGVLQDQNMPAAPAALAQVYPPAPPADPNAPIAHVDPARGPDPAMDPGVATSQIPNLVPGHADRTPAPTAPDLTPGLADQQTSTTSSSTSTTSGSSGLSPEAQKRTSENIDTVAGANSRAVDATAAVGTLQANQAEARSKMLLSDAANNIEKTAAEIAVNDHIQRETERKLQAGSDWRPDRAELFHGDQGVAFGLSAAVAAMAGAWMQGRGLTGANPYLPTIMKMIDDNVSDQVRKNSSGMQFLREQKGDLKAAALEMKQKQLRYAQQRLDGLALRDSSDIMRAGVEKTRQEMIAQNAKWEQEKRQSIERTTSTNTTKTLSHSNATKPAAAVGERTPDQAKAQGAFDAIGNFGNKAGLQRGPDGKWRVGGGAFPPAALEKLNPFSDDSIKSAAEAAVEAYGRLQSGGVIGAEERPAFQEQLGMNTLTRAQLAARLNAAENALHARLKSTDATKLGADTTAPAGWKK